jgi:hypothetical protein
MPKTPSIFAGLSLSEQTPAAEPPVDQRLFTPKPPVQTDRRPNTPDEPRPNPPSGVAATPRQPRQSVPVQEGKRERGKEGRREYSHEGGRIKGKEDFLLTNTTGASLYDLNTKPNRKDSFLFTDEEFLS